MAAIAGGRKRKRPDSKIEIGIWLRRPRAWCVCACVYVLYVFARVCARKRMACITRQTADFHFQGQARAGNEEGRYLLCTLLFHSTRVQEIKMALNLRRFLSGVFHFLQENSLFSHQGRWIIRALCI